MAIKIDIPGIGEVSIEGAAQEDTMQAILAAVSKTEKSKATDEKKNKKANEDLAKSSAKVKTGLDELEDELSGTEKTAKKLSNSMEETGDNISNASKQTVKNLGSFAASLALTATSVAVGFAKNFNDNAANPIAVGAALINTSIDLIGASLKIGVEAVSAFGGALLGAIPLIGGGLQRGVDGIAAVSKQVIDFSTTVLKAGNEMMAAEFDKTVKSMKQLTTAGASFSNGLTGLRDAANRSEIGLSAFSNIVAKAAPNLQAIGITATESTDLMSKGMLGLAKSVKGANGQMTTTRDQLLALGYSYEEQGEIMSLYMQQQAIAGKNLKNIAPEELAAGTKEYAKNLKVISDFTGKDAKVIMQKAQAESMRGALLDKLTAKQKVSFEAAYAGLEILGPKAAAAQLDLMQRLATDGASNIAEIQANPAMAAAQAKLAQGVLDTSATMVTARAGIIDAANTKSTLGKDTDIVGLMGIAGVGKDIGEMQNAINRFRGASKEAGDASIETADKQMNTQDDVTQGFTKATNALTKFQIETETLATTLMPMYATAIGDATEKTAKIVTAAMQLASGKISMKQFGDMMGMPGSDGNTENNKMSQKLKADREKKEDELTAAQDKLSWGSRMASKASENIAGVDNDEIRAAKQNLKNAREAEAKLLLAKRTYAAGLAEAMDSLAEHATAEDKAAATLKYNQKFIDDSAKGNMVTSADILGGRTKTNAKGMADYFVLPTTAKPATPDATTGVPTTVTGPGKAKGGISVGPTAGYHELLHGTEAVVPLPDNKSIPVKLDSSALTATLNEHTGILNNILLAMNKGNSLSSGILQNSY